MERSFHKAFPLFLVLMLVLSLPAELYAKKLASFKKERNAGRYVDMLRSQGIEAYCRKNDSNLKGKGVWYVVYGGKAADNERGGNGAWLSIDPGLPLAPERLYAQVAGTAASDGSPAPAGAASASVAAPLSEGIRQYQEENYEEAIEILKKARQEDPSSSTAAFFLGMSYKQTGDLLNAAPAFQDASTLKPAVKEAVVELIDALVQLERFDEALVWIDTAERNGIYPAKVSFLKGMTLMRQRRFDQAVTAFEKAKELDKGYTQAVDVQIGVAYLADRKYGKAKERLQAAVTQDPLSDLGTFARRYQDIVEDMSFIQRPLRVTLGVLGQYDTNMLQEPFLYHPANTPQVQSSNAYVNVSDQKTFALTTTARLDYVPILPGNWLFNASYMALSNLHEKNATTYDVFANSFSVAPGYNFGRFAVNLMGTYTHVMKRGDYENNGGGYRRYAENAVVGPLVRFLVNNDHILELSTGYAKKNNFKTVANPELNDMSVSGLDSYISWMWLYAQGGILNIKYGYTQDHASGVFYDNQGHRATVNMIVPLVKNLKLQLSGDIQWVDYRYENGNFDNIKRRDQIYAGTAGLTWDVNKNLSLLVQYTGTRAFSNIYAYDYDRSLYSVGCELKF